MTTPRQTILVVEDNGITRNKLRVALESAGYRVQEAADGWKAVGSFQEAAPDLVIQDLALPDMDGVELVRRLRALPGGETIPIVAFSGFLSRLEQARADAAGVTDYLFKPVEPSRIVETVKAHLFRGETSTENPGGGRTVLIVDDDPGNRTLLTIHLRQLGFVVDTASDGVDAHARIKRAPPDAVVSDVLMPRLDGFRLCALLKKSRRLAHIPVVLMSAAYQEAADDRMAHTVGASALVLRTPDFKEVIEALLRACDATTAPAASTPPAGEADQTYVHRVVRQLERQVAQKSDLTRRLALREAELSLVTSLQDLDDQPDVEAVAQQILLRALDAAAISKGAVYLLNAEGRLSLRAQLGYSESEMPQLQAFFGSEALLAQSLASGEVVQVPSPRVPDDEAALLLERSKTVGLIIVPVMKTHERLGVLVTGTGVNALAEEWVEFVRNVAERMAQALVVTRAFARTAAAEKQYRAIFDNALYGVFQSTPEGRLWTVNHAMARIFGYESPADMLARVDDIGSQLYAEPSRRAELVRLLTERGAVSRFEIAVRRKDGSHAWTSVTAKAIRDASGALRHIEGAVEDITERHQAEAATMALAELSGALSRSNDPDTVGRLATENLWQLLNAGSAAVYRNEEASGTLRLVTVSGPRQEAFHWFPRVGGGRAGMSGFAFGERRPVTSPDVLADPNAGYTAEQHAILAGDPDRAVLAVPLVVREKAFGALMVAARTGRVFTDDEIALAQAFADQAALALDNAHLVADLRTRESRLEALLEVSRRLAGFQPVGALLTQIAEACVGLLDAQMVGFRVVEGDELVLSSVAGDVDAFPRHRLRIGQSLSGMVAETGHPIVVPDLSADPLVAAEYPGHLRRQAWMGVPVKIGERVVGVLSVFAPVQRAYSDTDLAIATAFSAQAAVAIENARLYDEVRTGRDFLESITRDSVDAIVTTDEQGRIAYLSPGGERMFGYRPEEIIGRLAGDFYAAGAEEARDLMKRLEQDVRIAQHETTLRAKDGRLLDINMSLSLLRDAGGAVKGTIGVLRDMTERKRMEANLRQSEKIGAMGALLAGVAHELNNPLAVVSGHAAILKQTATDPRLVARAGKMADAADRCARIIKNFLALARQAPPERHTVDLNHILRDALELLAYPLRVDSVTVSLELSEDLPPLWADGNQLHQVIVNLVTNAHHALREVPPPRRLTVSSRFDVDRASIHFGVADNGPGMPVEIQARIFEPFFTTKGVGRGTGLGLSLCHGIVADHGGTIEVASGPGGGAVFSIRLPASAPGAHADEAHAPVTGPPVPPCSVLIVDDEPDVAAVLEEMLAARGHRVESAGNGQLALEKLAESDYDVILTDLRMPVLDGRGLHREAERRQPGLTSRFGFITGDALNEETMAFLAGVRAPHLGKPYSIEDVDRVLRQILAQRAGGA